MWVSAGVVGTLLSHVELEEHGVTGPEEQIQGKQVWELLISILSKLQCPCPAVPEVPTGSLVELGTAAEDARLIPPTAEPWSRSWPQR